jgi:hypothetical protein
VNVERECLPHAFECVSAYKRHRKTILVNAFAIMDSDIDQGQPMLPISDLVPRRGNLRALKINPYEVMQARNRRYQRQSAICLSGSRARCLGVRIASTGVWLECPCTFARHGAPRHSGSLMAACPEYSAPPRAQTRAPTGKPTSPCFLNHSHRCAWHFLQFGEGRLHSGCALNTPGKGERGNVW